MTNSVHLEGVRCDGSGHDGCQASCLIFWKESWLKRAAGDLVLAENLQPPQNGPSKLVNICTVEAIHAAASAANSQGEQLFACSSLSSPFRDCSKLPLLGFSTKSRQEGKEPGTPLLKARLQKLPSRY